MLKASQAELAEANARMQATLDAAVDGIITSDARGTIETANAAALLLFGYTADELVGSNVKMLMPPPYADEHDRYLDAYRKTGKKRIIGIGREVVGLRKDGTTFPIELSVGEAFAGERKVFSAVMRDLTQRRESQEARASFALILEESLNEIYVFDAESLRFMLVNRGARENLGYSIEELHELTPLDIKPEFTAERFKRLIAPLRTGKMPRLQFETTHRRKDGSDYPVEVHLQLTSYAGKASFVALIFDLTQRKAALRSLERTERRALEAEKLASVATLTAGIAHDIGTPMGIILGYANMIEKSAEDEKQRERAALISQQTKRVTDLIQTLLNVSRPGEPTLVAIELDKTVDHALEFFREKLRKHNITVERDYKKIPEITGDPDRLEQVFLNLFVNAADAMADGGELHVRLRARKKRWVEIRVRDTGAGIAKDQLAKVFDPFFTTKERGKGNGLGLLVSKSIVTEHGGTIDVKSELGAGTEFLIGLPVNPK